MTDSERDRAVRICVDMGGRYFQDIEGCDADELERYGEGMECSLRLAYIIKYDKFPPKDHEIWRQEFLAMPEWKG